MKSNANLNNHPGVGFVSFPSSTWEPEADSNIYENKSTVRISGARYQEHDTGS